MSEIPYPEEVLVPAQDICGGVRLDVGVHVRLPHPGGAGGRAEAQRGRLVALRFAALCLLFDVVCSIQSNTMR